ncbi:molybdenum ABC transporter permease, partial [Clostridioides difficile]|nr:molybdenum ABC transporter permease [Clostridioides difficile]
MKNKFFTILLTGFFAVVFLFIVSPLLMLIIKGISYVPICLKSVEVQYAITLSIKTSLISTIVCLL